MDPTILGSPRPVVHGGTITVTGKDRRSIAIGAAPCVVGRDPNCQLVLQDRRVSATHAELVATEHGLRVRDLGSSNGTLLGEHRIVEALLSTPAAIRCGDTVLEYQPGKPQRVALSAGDAFGPLAGGTPHMRALFARLKRLARTNLSALICGETGTGKELAAKAIHEASARAGKAVRRGRLQLDPCAAGGERSLWSRERRVLGCCLQGTVPVRRGQRRHSIPR